MSDTAPEHCRWIVREGFVIPYWARTTCTKSGFNPLTRAAHVYDIKELYDDRICPICGRPISCSGYVFEEDFEEEKR